MPPIRTWHNPLILGSMKNKCVTCVVFVGLASPGRSALDFCFCIALTLLQSTANTAKTQTAFFCNTHSYQRVSLPVMLPAHHGPHWHVSMQPKWPTPTCTHTLYIFTVSCERINFLIWGRPSSSNLNITRYPTTVWWGGRKEEGTRGVWEIGKGEGGVRRGSEGGSE